MINQEIKTKEVNFEEEIEQYLINHGYSKWNSKNYNREKAIDINTLIHFIENTQEEEWNKYKKIYPTDFEKKLLKRFNDSVDNYGLLYVLRHGIEDRGVKLKFIAFKPNSKLNRKLIENYNKNIFYCCRQFKYSIENENSIDLVIMINGIPLIAIELKNQLTGQSVFDAKLQYMNDRDPKEYCFHFNTRFLVYFAVDLYEVAMTTQLQGKKTYFLPFNQGSNGPGKVGGAGNPTMEGDYTTSYLWKDILSKDSLLSLIQKFIHVQTEDVVKSVNGIDKKIKRERLIFPRFHQLDVVRKIISDVKTNGSGKNYLIQHSAGSGKSNSIAWLCYNLASLHDFDNKPIFNSIIVVTDRKVLDSQLQETIYSFEHTRGLVEKIDKNKSSKDLRDAINSGKKIIITTLQKFPIIYNEIEDIKGKQFAIIIDEAHSSQTGSSAQKMKVALADKEEALREFAEFENKTEDEMKDEEDYIVEQMLAHGKHSNLSFFAFTATPKSTTLELFGQVDPDTHKYVPFHIYSMKQAIEEGFILDVLSHYMTYKECYKIAKETPDNPELPVNKAIKAVRRYESLHPHNLSQKTAIIIETYRNITKNKINGRAKAMVVTASRLHAVRYYHEFKNYLEKKHYDDIEILIAFSGVINDENSEYTEEKLNKRKDGTVIREEQLKDEFHKDEYSMLIVAEKYQTGFDEPLLHTMFVDKKLKGVKAVQTLSRLNRIYPGKTDTFVLDFVNTKEEIKEAFQPYYESTILDEAIDVNLIYETRNKLESFKLFNRDDISLFIKNVFKKGKTQLGMISSLLKPVINRYNDLNDTEKYEFKKVINNFNKWYSFISQITRIFDKELYEEYIFSSYLSKLLPKKTDNRNVNLDEKIKLEYYKLEKTFEGNIKLAPSEEDRTLKVSKKIDVTSPMQNDELLDSIVNRINDRFKGVFTDNDKVIVETIYKKCVKDNKKLESYAINNDEEVFNQSIFPEIFKKVAQECYMEQMKAFSKLFEDKNFYNSVMESISKEAYKDLRTQKDK